MLSPLGNIAFSVAGIPLTNASLPRMGLTPGSLPIISNSKLSAIKSPITFGSGFSKVFSSARARSFCSDGFIAGSFLKRSVSPQHQHRAGGMANELFGHAADQDQFAAAAAVGGYDDQVDAVLRG